MLYVRAVWLSAHFACFIVLLEIYWSSLKQITKQVSTIDPKCLHWHNTAPCPFHHGLFKQTKPSPSLPQHLPALPTWKVLAAQPSASSCLKGGAELEPEWALSYRSAFLNSVPLQMAGTFSAQLTCPEPWQFCSASSGCSRLSQDTFNGL